MAIDDEDAVFGRPRPKTVVHTLGEPLDSYSADELSARIEILKREIERIEEAKTARAATHAAAAAFFKN